MPELDLKPLGQQPLIHTQVPTPIRVIFALLQRTSVKHHYKDAFPWQRSIGDETTSLYYEHSLLATEDNDDIAVLHTSETLCNELMNLPDGTILTHNATSYSQDITL